MKATPAGPAIMVHSNPDLASSVGASQTVSNVENPGMTDSPPVQMHNDSPIPQQQSAPSPSTSRPPVEKSPSTSSSSDLTRAAEEADVMTVAVDIPLLRHSSYSFDPWSPRKKKHENGCSGCAKIAKARALAAAVAVAAANNSVVSQGSAKSTTPTPDSRIETQLEGESFILFCRIPMARSSSIIYMSTVTRNRRARSF